MWHLRFSPVHFVSMGAKVLYCPSCPLLSPGCTEEQDWSFFFLKSTSLHVVNLLVVFSTLVQKTCQPHSCTIIPESSKTSKGGSDVEKGHQVVTDPQ